MKKSDKMLSTWQERFERAYTAYAGELSNIEERESIYAGSRQIEKSPNSRRAVDKRAPNVRNIVFELIESQIDSAVPAPKVTSALPGKEVLAAEIEDMLRGEIDRIPFEYLNDEDERTTPIQGGDFFLVEWDNQKHTHTTLGELSVRTLHPRQVIPQPGVYRLEDADYIFVRISQTKEYIRRRYNVDVSGEESGETKNDELCTQVMCYYKDEDGEIGVFSWVGDTVLYDLPSYQKRRHKRCTVCGTIEPAYHKVCTKCGEDKLEVSTADYEELTDDIVLTDAAGKEYKRIPATQRVMDEKGRMVTRPTRIPVYRPGVFPILVRRNVSINAKLMGNSDVDFIKDQQNAIKKIGLKLEEKLFRGGSLVTLPRDVAISADDEELKIAYVRDPAQKALIGVYSLQPNMQNDHAMMEANYQWARQTIGITDSFQGRIDPTATSGRAKEFSAAQSAGRFESKRRMKQAFYSDVFRVMFLFMLAYADEPRSYYTESIIDGIKYRIFNRYDFLEQDICGEWYWNDRFFFSTDTTGTLIQNREAMWQETRQNFRDGAFGDPSDPKARELFWRFMENLHYPHAGSVRQLTGEAKS